MSDERTSIYDWPRFGAIAGLLGVATYIVVIAAPLPDRVAAFFAALLDRCLASAVMVSLGC